MITNCHRANIGMTIMQFPTSWAKDDDEYLKKTEDAIKEFQNSPYVNIWLAPHAPYTGKTTFLNLDN